MCGQTYKWTVGALSALHEGSEARIITILEKANLAAIHTGRVTLMPKDVELAMKLSDATEHYKTMKSVTEKASPEEEERREESRKKQIELIKKRTEGEKRNVSVSKLTGSTPKQTGSTPAGSKRTGSSVPSGSSVTIVTPFRAISSEDSSDVPVIINRCNRKRKLVETSESEEETAVTPKKNVRCSKKLTKDQFDFFEKEQGFTDELISIVLDEGWDKVDIENFILLYNHKNDAQIPLPTFRRERSVYRNESNREKDGENDKKKKDRKENLREDSGAEKKKGKNGKSKGGKKNDGGKSSEKKDAEKSEGGKSSEKKNGKKIECAKSSTEKDGKKKDGKKSKRKNKSSMDDLGEIVHYGTNVMPNEVGLLYREGRSSDTLDNDDTEESVDINRNRDENNNADDREGNLVTEESDFTTLDEIRRDKNENVDSSGKREENVDDNRNEEVTDRGNQEDENVDDNRNEEVTDTGNQEGEENVDENGNEEVSDKGVANTDGGEQERRYQCKFCIHSFDVYSAYIIHVESKHEGWRDSQLAENIQDRLDAQAQAQGESEQSDSLPVYDERDEGERELVE